MSHANRFIPLGVITGAHGVRGAFKLKPFTDDIDSLAKRPLADASGTSYTLKVTGEAKGQLICTLPGITDRNAVDALKGKELGTTRDRLPAAGNGEYYISDLIGMAVVTPSGEPIGIVAQFHNYGAGDLLEIRLESTGKTELFPFNDATFPDIDTNTRQIICNPPEMI